MKKAIITAVVSIVVLTACIFTANVSAGNETLYGYITDESGSGINGAMVRVYHDNIEKHIEKTDITDSNGYYSITGLDNAPYHTIEISADGFLTLVKHDITLNQQNDFTLEDSNRIKGYIEENDGDPATGLINIWIVNWTKNISTSPDGSGYYEFKTDITAGEWTFNIEIKPDIFSGGGHYVDVYNSKKQINNGTNWINFTLQDSGKIQGNVQNSNNQDIQGALINIYDSDNKLVGTEITDSNGDYSFADIDATGYYDVRVDADTYIGEQVNNIYVSVGGTVAQNFQLDRSGRISGTVEDDNGNALEGAYVYSTDTNGKILSEAYTDENGDYLLDDNMNDNTDYDITASFSGYLTETQSATAKAPPRLPGTANFALSDSGIISGTVKDQGNNNLQSAKVSIYKNSILIGETETDSNGQYSFADNLNTGTYYVNVTYLNFLPQNSSVSVTAGQTTTKNFNLAKSGSIAGKVVDENNNAIENVLIIAYSSKYREEGKTNTNGNFALPVNTPFYAGTYTVEIYSCLATSKIFENVQVNDGQITNIGTIQLKQSGRISGYAFDSNGDLLTNVEITLGAFKYTTDSYGYYHIFSRLDTATYNITINAWEGTKILEIEAIQGQLIQKNISYNSGNLSGEVRDKDTGEVLENVKITLEENIVYTDENGTYFIKDIMSGEKQVKAELQNYKIETKTVNIVSKQTINLDFDLEKLPGKIEVVVKDENNNLLSGVELTINSNTYYTDSNGYYLIEDISAGNYGLTARKTNYDIETKSVSVFVNQTTNLDITLYQKTSPTITNLNPTDGSTINTNTPTISADYTDNREIDLSSIIMKIDGNTVSPSKTSTSVSYTVLTPLIYGQHTVEIEVKDRAGNLAKRTWKFTVNSKVEEFTNGNIKVIFDYTGTNTPSVNLVSDPQGSTPGALNLFADINSNGVSFAYAKIEISYSDSDIPFGYDENTFRIYYWKNNIWTIAENTYSDSSKNKVYANITHLTIFTAKANETGKGNLQGTVKDEDGNAIGNANVVIENTPLSTTTNSQGSYYFSNIPAGSYNVKVEKTNYATEIQNVIITTESTTTLDFTLEYSVPILSVEYITFSSNTPREDDTIRISAKITNDGADANNINVKIKIDSTIIANSSLSIGKGKYKMVDATWKAVEGTYTVYILIEDLIHKTEQITVNSSLPNIKVDSITFSNDSPTEGDEVEITVKLKNLGGNAEIEIRVRVDGVSIKSETLEISKGQTKDYIVKWKSTKGSKIISVEINGVEKKTETIEVAEKPPSGGGFISGFEFALLLSAVLLIFAIRRRK